MFGEIEGVTEGQIFESRRELHDANVHNGLMRGIGKQGASIVLSGGYVDDEDLGDEIIYTGQGGRDPNTGLQVRDQTLTKGNKFLEENYRLGNPIRVIRGSQHNSPYSPASGYIYSGLYRIESVSSPTGAHGFLIYRFKLNKISEGESFIQPPPQGQQQPNRAQVITSRVIRNSAIGNHVKEMYDYTCQVSGVRLEAPNGPYAEACHIKPVGKPHNGPDDISNVLCLSPNIHVLFDLGAIAINDDLTLIGHEGSVNIIDGHNVDLEALKYHRENIFRG